MKRVYEFFGMDEESSSLRAKGRQLQETGRTIEILRRKIEKMKIDLDNYLTEVERYGNDDEHFMGIISWGNMSDKYKSELERFKTAEKVHNENLATHKQELAVHKEAISLRMYEFFGMDEESIRLRAQGRQLQETGRTIEIQRRDIEDMKIHLDDSLAEVERYGNDEEHFMGVIACGHMSDKYQSELERFKTAEKVHNENLATHMQELAAHKEGISLPAVKFR